MMGVFDALPFPALVWFSAKNTDWRDASLIRANSEAMAVLRPEAEWRTGERAGRLFPSMEDELGRALLEGTRIPRDLPAQTLRYVAPPTLFQVKLRPVGSDCCSMVMVECNELERARQTAARQLEIKAQLLYFASHDLAEPLRAARVFAGLAAKEDDESTRHSHLKRVDETLERAQSMLAALNEYRKLSGLEPNGPVELEEALQEAAELVPGLQDHGRLSTEGHLPTLRVNRFALIAVLRNLLSNAVKYRKDGEKVSIQVSAARYEGKLWKITIEDDGVGFPQVHAERIFKLGERLYSDGERWGHGIGLANCRAAIESQGGRIWAESQPDRGARFHFTLPGAAADSLR